MRGQKRCEKAIFWGEGRAVWHVGVLVPQLGSKPMPPAGEAKFFITGTPGKSQRSERRWEKNSGARSHTALQAGHGGWSFFNCDRKPLEDFNSGVI